MCCEDCGPVRCRGCPSIDWSSYTWLWQSPASVSESEISGLARRFADTTYPMVRTSACECHWIMGNGEYAREVSPVWTPGDGSFPVGSLGVLRLVNSGKRSQWELRLTRYNWDAAWFTGGLLYNGYGWNDGVWNGNRCNAVANYGYGSLGYGYWGYDYWFNNYLNSGLTANYSLVGRFNCTGINRFNRNDAGRDEFYEPNSWPAFVEVSRIPIDNVL